VLKHCRRPEAAVLGTGLHSANGGNLSNRIKIISVIESNKECFHILRLTCEAKQRLQNQTQNVSIFCDLTTKGDTPKWN
jgi:hypothetical protein